MTSMWCRIGLLKKATTLGRARSSFSVNRGLEKLADHFGKEDLDAADSRPRNGFTSRRNSLVWPPVLRWVVQDLLSISQSEIVNVNDHLVILECGQVSKLRSCCASLQM